jgi:hypothetical protein
MTMPEKEFIRRIVWLRDAPGTLSEKRECLIDKFKAGEVTETEYEAGLKTGFMTWDEWFRRNIQQNKKRGVMSAPQSDFNDKKDDDACRNQGP